jgi:hypothetical protein
VYNKCVILLSKWVTLNAAPCIFCIHQLLAKKKNWYEIIYILQGSLRFVKMELSFNILIEFDRPIKTVQLIRMCLNKLIVTTGHVNISVVLLRTF